MSDKPEGTADRQRVGVRGDAADILREDTGGVLVFVVGNENVFPKQAEEITAAVRAVIDGTAAPRALLDLARVQYICSAFVGNILDLHKVARERGGELKVCVKGEHVAYTMKLVKVEKIIHIGGDRQQLLAAF